MSSAGDHLVGWGNSSVRHPDSLPDLGDLTRAKGIVRKDSAGAAFSFTGGQEADESGLSITGAL